MTAEYALYRNQMPTPVAERDAVLADPKFGTVFTDHMAQMTWHVDGGWRDARVVPYGPLQLDPAAAVLHYGQEIFEGMKAYRHPDGSVWTFRPEANARRFALSAERLALPVLPEEDFIAGITALMSVDADWVPAGAEMSLYIRPFMIATEAFLGVRPAHRAEFLVIASPVGPYFTGGIKPVDIWIPAGYHRAAPGGTGGAKCGGNYAAALLPQQLADERGFDQVCFLDAMTNTHLEELGGMNVFVVHADGTVATPALEGTILAGITRDSVIDLLHEDGHEVVQRDLPIADLLAGIESGAVTEVFACGTAAVVTPIGRLASDTFDVRVNGSEAGPVTLRVRERLTDIQFGRTADTHGWMYRLA